MRAIRDLTRCPLLSLSLALSWAHGVAAQVDCREVVRPHDAGAATRDPATLGYCLVAAERFAEALERVPAAADAGLAKVRGMALYHLGRDAEALAALASASAGDAEVRFYRGMLAWRARDWSTASRELERARRLDPARVEPAASFYAALAWRARGDEARAREALQRVSDDWDGSDWARRARRELEGGAPRGRAPARWAWIEVGAENDDNVVLRGTDAPLASEISSERDQRAAWRMHAGRYLLDRDPWKAGAALSYAGWIHDELDDFDVHFPSVTLWLDRDLGDRWAARTQYDFGFAWVDDDSFLAAHDLRAALLHARGSGRSELFTRVYGRDYRFPIRNVMPATGDRRDRDGKGVEIGGEHTLSLPLEATLRVGLSHERFDAEGRDYSFAGNGGLAELAAPLSAQIRLRLSARYQHRSYRHRSSFGSLRHRNERDARYALELERALPRDLTLLGRLSYRHNDSSVQVFDFRRYIAGIYLRWSWSAAGS